MADRVGERFERLVEIMRTLRAPDGCPWDREQTHASLRPFVLEETYEVLEAIESGQPANLAAAQQIIDILSLLEEKTRGNLTAEERQLLEQLLYELRMRYVEATKGAPSEPSRIIIP